MSDFVSELTSLLNRHSKENGSGTPDFILAEYLFGCLSHFNGAVNRCRCETTERMNLTVTNTLHDTLWRSMQAHGVGWIDNGTPDARCYCGHRPDRLGASWHAHVADAVILEIPQLQQPVSMSDYAAHLCQSGCDCSCCYGMDGCYHVTDPCNCGMNAKDHRDRHPA